MSWDSIDHVATSCGLDGPGYESQQQKGYFYFPRTAGTALGLTQTLIQWIPCYFQGTKLMGCEVDHSYLCSAEV